MNRRVWITFGLLLLTEVLAAQSFDKADALFKRGAYYRAIQEYYRTLAEFPEGDGRGYLEFRTGICCMRMNHYTNAREWLVKAEKTGYVDQELFWELGEVYLITGDYQKAKEYFERYRELVPDHPRVAAKLASCEFGKEPQSVRPDVMVEALPYINTRGSEYGISFINGGILYSSTGDLLPEKQREVSQRTGMGYSKPYLSQLREGEYQPGVLLKGISRTSANEGSFSFDPVSEKLYCTRCEEDMENCRLIVARLNKQECRQTGVLKIGKNGYNIAHPFVTENGVRLYFSSTLPGGYGGSDIWYVEKNVWNEWGEPVNVGPEVNTPGNEVFPYVWSDRLFFASDGRVGYGGLDLYESKITSSGFEQPVNLGVPINTSYDDFNLILHRDGRGGLLVSNRTPGRSDDIFRFEWGAEAEQEGVVEKEEKKVVALEEGKIAAEKQEERKVEERMAVAEAIVLKGEGERKEEDYRMGVEVGQVKQLGWWVQVAMLMESKIIPYEMAVQVTQISGRRVVMYRGNDGGHRFYIGVYTTEQEARTAVAALKSAGIDCFIKNVTE